MAEGRRVFKGACRWRLAHAAALAQLPRPMVVFLYPAHFVVLDSLEQHNI